MLKFAVGEHVKVHRGHWLRPHAVGQIIEIDEKKGDHCYLIRFRKRFTGGGIRGESLWLAGQQLLKLGAGNIAKRSLPKNIVKTGS
ncbi:MAG: DUF1918 domain-containing protein [Candidatus Binatia bacterium]